MENKENKEAAVAVVEKNLPAEVHKKGYITQILESTMTNFLAVNEGLELDYVRMGDWVKINRKGNFVLSSDETVSFGDSIDVVIGKGEQRYMVWGADKSPEKGELIVAERNREDAEAALTAWLDQNPEAKERYNLDNVKLRYLAYIVFAEDINAEDVPPIYLISYAPGDSYGWGTFTRNVFNGHYKTTHKIPKGSGANTVITRLISEVRDVKGSTDSYVGIKFEPVGLFIPAEFGIQE